MTITLVSSRSVGTTTQELKLLSEELDLGDTEELISGGKPVRSTVTAGIDLSDLGLEEDDLLLDDEEDVPVSTEEEAATQEALVTLLDAYVLLMPGATEQHLDHLGQALGMTEEERISFCASALAIMQPEGPTMDPSGGPLEEEEDDLDAEDDDDTDNDPFIELLLGSKVGGAKDAVASEDDDDEWEDGEEGEDEFAAVLSSATSPLDALQDPNDFDLGAGDLNALKDDANLPVNVTATRVIATPEEEEFKLDLRDDGQVGTDDPSGIKEEMRDDGEPGDPLIDHEETNNDGEPQQLP